jgi:hypothetical protein
LGLLHLVFHNDSSGGCGNRQQILKDQHRSATRRRTNSVSPYCIVPGVSVETIAIERAIAATQPTFPSPFLTYADSIGILLLLPPTSRYQATLPSSFLHQSSIQPANIKQHSYLSPHDMASVQPAYIKQPFPNPNCKPPNAIKQPSQSPLAPPRIHEGDPSDRPMPSKAAYRLVGWLDGVPVGYKAVKTMCGRS